jgi:hypothetical protein
MPLSSIQAGIAALLAVIGNAAVALGLIGATPATEIESAVVGLVGAIFVLANAVIHHGVTTTTGKDASAR